MRIGINLLWVRPGRNGGTESYIRNLLDGFLQNVSHDEYVLYVSDVNKESFDKYLNDKKFIGRICYVDSNIQVKRVIWENICLNRQAKKDRLDLWFMPVYCKPLLADKRIPYITVIHDIQAKHYPEYFSKIRNIFFDVSWRNACRTSACIITISEFCKRDIMEHYKISEEKIKVIYNPIIVNKDILDFSTVSKKYGITDKDYYYTVSAIAKHKNIITLLRMMEKLKKRGVKKKLIITGVKVNANEEINQFVEEHRLWDVICFTGYIPNEERDSLYEHCEVFLFPSVFEGFGMPPVEALWRGVPVVTTKLSSIYEVTQGKAIYVDDPFDEEEWIEKINTANGLQENADSFIEYGLMNVISKYERVFHKQMEMR